MIEILLICNMKGVTCRNVLLTFSALWIVFVYFGFDSALMNLISCSS